MTRLISCPRHPGRVPMLLFGPHDRITIGRTAYTCVRSDQRGHLFVQVDNPLITEEYTHEKIVALKLCRDWRVDEDFFSPESARRRLETDVYRFNDLPEKEKPDALYRYEFCKRFIRGYEAGDYNKSDEQAKVAVLRIFLELEAFENENARRASEEARRPRSKASATRPAGVRARKPHAGPKIPAQIRRPPHVRTVHRWCALLKQRGPGPESLRDGRYRSGPRAARIQGKALELLVRHGKRYATEERPNIIVLFADLRADVTEYNKTVEPQDWIDCPSKATLGNYIAGLGRYAIYLGRYGAARAAAKFALITSGLGRLRPFERIEIDSWQVDLQAILTTVGLWDRLSGKTRCEVARMHFCSAIDVSTKVIVGACLSETPSVAAALAVLRMTLTDKSAYGAAAGAILPWDQHATFGEIAADGGPQFNNSQFMAAVANLGMSPIFPSGGVPSLRGTKESFFRTVGMQLVARFPGKTFENVVSLADYDSEGKACIETPDLARIMTRWLVDAYHGTPHDGLAGQTPHDAWIEQTKLYPLRAPPDRHRIRSVFGIPLKRRLGNGGIRVLGLRYWCEELTRHFLHHGPTDMEVMLDAADLGEIAVRIDGTWHCAQCVRAGFEDVGLEAWLRTRRELARKHAAGAALTQATVDEAIRAVGALSQASAARIDISMLPPSSHEVEIAERELFRGWTMPEADADVLDGAPTADPLDGGIPTSGPDAAGSMDRDWLPDDDFDVEA